VTPMHVGWVARFDPPEQGEPPTAEQLIAHLGARFERAPRYRQRLAGVPFDLHEPVWVDDDDFDTARHLHAAETDDLDALADEVFSRPLQRDRPLWEMWIADDLLGGGLALVGKAHHCMVDGTAVVELGNLILDQDPHAWTRHEIRGGAWSPARSPSSSERLGRALLDRAADGASVALAPLRLASSPARMLGLPGAATRGARTLGHTLLPPAPGSPLNEPGTGQRHHVRVTRSLDDIRAIRRRFGVTPNDVILAACAGALRRFAERRGEVPQRLKAMVPADVRSSTDAEASGNRISFVFIELPCDEPDPLARLQAIQRATAQRLRDGEAEDLDVAFRALALSPRPLQRVLAHAFAHPRLFNLVISSVPGPAVPRYLRGCRLRTVHSAVPLVDRHALSIGAVTVAGNVCFGVYADAVTLPGADALAPDLHHAVDELLAAPADG
jgi:diacylglycerol O-acyltransferase